MTINKHVRVFTMAAASLIASLLLAAAAQPLKIDFSNDSVGAEPKSFLSVVGVWRIEADGDNKVLVVDGRQWKEGQASAGLADKARALYGERYAEFLDRVQAYAIFRMSWPRTWTIFATARSPSGSKEFQAVSIKERESCSTSNRTVIT
jgi:hypothetical protein